MASSKATGAGAAAQSKRCSAASLGAEGGVEEAIWTAGLKHPGVASGVGKKPRGSLGLGKTNKYTLLGTYCARSYRAAHGYCMHFTIYKSHQSLPLMIVVSAP